LLGVSSRRREKDAELVVERVADAERAELQITQCQQLAQQIRPAAAVSLPEINELPSDFGGVALCHASGFKTLI
jgi:hypothetical protein